jgi:hypothetical protein
MAAGFFWGFNENGAGLVTIRAAIPLAMPAWRGFPCPLIGGHGLTSGDGI